MIVVINRRWIIVSNDLIIRSSSAEFLIFERQTHDNGIQVKFFRWWFMVNQKKLLENYLIQLEIILLCILMIYMITMN